MNKYFGTDGVRGVANDKLTSTLAYKIGRFIGQPVNGKRTRIILGRDTRLSGAMLDAGLIAGITTSGGDVYHLGTTTTPSISYLVETEHFDYGIMVSASHNPFYDNGIKIFAPSGEKLGAEIEAKIEEYIDAERDFLPFAKNSEIGSSIYSETLKAKYLDFIASKANPNIKGLKIIIDCANGSASKVADNLFNKRLGLGATIINASPNGTNINNNCGSTHISNLCKLTKEGRYDIGIAFDGDADRCMFSDKNGNLVDGDAVMFLNAINMKKHNKLKENKIVITVMSNLGLKKALEKNNIGYEETTVGDKYVQACLKAKGLSLGGEQSGHIIFNEDLNTGDGMLTAVHVLNILADEKESLDNLLKDFVIYPQVLKNVGVSNKDFVMNNDGLKELISKLDKELNGNGRILVRPSGTEQLVRVMVEAENLSICDKIASKLVDFITELSY